jgi:sulfite exporter TauE/SafE
MSSGTGTSLVLIAIGAILAFAVTTTVGFVDLQAVGWILMVVGIIGLVVDLALYAPRRRDDRTRRY